MPGPQLGDEIRIGDLRPRHLDTGAASLQCRQSRPPTETIEPCAITGTSTTPAINAASSMLNPAGWWKSGRVCSTEKIEPRTTTR